MGGRASRLGGIAALREAAGPAQASGRGELEERQHGPGLAPQARPLPGRTVCTEPGHPESLEPRVYSGCTWLPSVMF